MALSGERNEALRRSASMARAFGVRIEEISVNEIPSRYPFLNTHGVVSGVYLEDDGQGDLANIAQALTKGARLGGVKIFENVKVTGFEKEGTRIHLVHCDQNLACTPFRPRMLSIMLECGPVKSARRPVVNVPLHACEHFYMVTEPIAELTRLPVLRVPNECAYYKEDAGKFLVGAFERHAKPWGMDGIPEIFEFDQLPEDLNQFEPILMNAIERMPILKTAGVQTFFNGPVGPHP